MSGVSLGMEASEDRNAALVDMEEETIGEMTHAGASFSGSQHSEDERISRQVVYRLLHRTKEPVSYAGAPPCIPVHRILEFSSSFGHPEDRQH